MDRKFQLVRDGDYPGTDLPVYKVYDAAEYNDTSVRSPRSIGEVWGVGFKGVAGKWVPTGVRYQLNGSWVESPELPAGHYGAAARALIATLPVGVDEPDLLDDIVAYHDKSAAAELAAEFGTDESEWTV